MYTIYSLYELDQGRLRILSQIWVLDNFPFPHVPFDSTEVQSSVYLAQEHLYPRSSRVYPLLLLS
jgi:hypothetical protein